VSEVPKACLRWLICALGGFEMVQVCLRELRYQQGEKYVLHVVSRWLKRVKGS
jgi:hypothetical protein